MDERKLGVIEARFADLIWGNAPLSSGELVRLCEAELGWKKSTTYTVLKKLCQREIFQNEGGVVSARISRDDFFAAQSRRFVEESFAGSLPAFIAAFSAGKGLTPREIEEIRRMMDEMEG
jgi:predicted transcriptional regulator